MKKETIKWIINLSVITALIGVACFIKPLPTRKSSNVDTNIYFYDSISVSEYEALKDSTGNYNNFNF